MFHYVFGSRYSIRIKLNSVLIGFGRIKTKRTAAVFCYNFQMFVLLLKIKLHFCFATLSGMYKAVLLLTL